MCPNLCAQDKQSFPHKTAVNLIGVSCCFRSEKLKTAPFLPQWQKSIFYQSLSESEHLSLLFYQPPFTTCLPWPVQYATCWTSCKLPFQDTFLSTGELLQNTNGQRAFRKSSGGLNDVLETEQLMLFVPIFVMRAHLGVIDLKNIWNMGFRTEADMQSVSPYLKADSCCTQIVNYWYEEDEEKMKFFYLIRCNVKPRKCFPLHFAKAES